MIKAPVQLLQRIAASLLALALVAGDLSVCAGWMPAPETRLACCSHDAECSEPASTAHHSKHRTNAAPQPDADRCCAVSEHRDPAQPPAAAGVVISLTVVASPVSLNNQQTGSPSPAWRTVVPIPAGHVPKHLLLSVLLV